MLNAKTPMLLKLILIKADEIKKIIIIYRYNPWKVIKKSMKQGVFSSSVIQSISLSFFV